MTYHYTKLDDGEGLDGGARYEIDEALGFTVCVVDDEKTARLFCAAPQLLEGTEDLLGMLSSLADEYDICRELVEEAKELREAIRQAKGGDA